MDVADAKTLLKTCDRTLDTVAVVLFHAFERDGRALRVFLTPRLRKAARKEGVWRSKEMLVTLKNAAYGFDEGQARSGGGRDGLFVLDRTFRPANAMMRKLFDRFLDRPESGAGELAELLGVPLGDLLPVRLVSHHLRLLGVLARSPDHDSLVLVDCDRSD